MRGEPMNKRPGGKGLVTGYARANTPGVLGISKRVDEKVESRLCRLFKCGLASAGWPMRSAIPLENGEWSHLNQLSKLLFSGPIRATIGASFSVSTL